MEKFLLIDWGDKKHHQQQQNIRTTESGSMGVTTAVVLSTMSLVGLYLIDSPADHQLYYLLVRIFLIAACAVPMVKIIFSYTS